MARRSGLGRGLAALIPPSGGEPDRGEQDRPGSSPAEDAGVTPAPVDAGTSETEDEHDPGDDDGSSMVVVQSGGVGSSTSQEQQEVSQDASVGAVEPSEVDLDDDRPMTPQSATTEDLPVDTATDQDPHLPSTERSARPAEASADSPAVYAELSPDEIRANPRQPREVFDPEEIEGLATSLRDVGVLQPLVVRPLDGGGYELVAGERRLRAARLAGLTAVPALIRRTEDADLLKEALVENIHRVQLNPLEEAAAYQQLLDEFGVSQEELARRLGRSRPAIGNAIRLLALPPEIQRRVAAGVLSAGHAKALLAVDGPEQQRRIAERIVNEGLSVRATEELVRLRLTDEEPASSTSRKRPPTAPGLLELQDDLSDALEARVRISMGARKGKLAIEFSSVDDLERIVSVIADGLGARGRTVSPPDEMDVISRQDD